MCLKLPILALAVLVLTGCATAFTLVEPGTVAVGDMQVMADGRWNKATAMMTPYAHRDAQVWTNDGLLLDRLMIIPAVSDGEKLFEATEDDIALPAFRANMLPNEVAELVESSIVKVLGEGDVVVSTSGLRPQTFGDQRGALFDIYAELGDGPDYRGMAGGFVANDKLYLVIFLGAHPYYADKHRDAAEAIIKSARI